MYLGTLNGWLVRRGNEEQVPEDIIGHLLPERSCELGLQPGSETNGLSQGQKPPAGQVLIEGVPAAMQPSHIFDWGKFEAFLLMTRIPLDIQLLLAQNANGNWLQGLRLNRDSFTARRARQA